MELPKGNPVRGIRKPDREMAAARLQPALGILPVGRLDGVTEHDARRQQHERHDEAHDHERRHRRREPDCESDHEQRHRQRQHEVADAVGEQRPALDLASPATDAGRRRGNVRIVCRSGMAKSTGGCGTLLALPQTVTFRCSRSPPTRSHRQPTPTTPRPSTPTDAAHVFHYSEDGTIRRFAPHVPQTNPGHRRRCGRSTPSHSPLYWFPRRCPRISVWARDEPEQQAAFSELFESEASRIVAAETDWMEPGPRRQALSATCSTLRRSKPWDDADGQYVSHDVVYPGASRAARRPARAARRGRGRIAVHATAGRADGPDPRVRPPVQLRANPRRPSDA